MNWPVWVVIKTDCGECGGAMGVTVFDHEPGVHEIADATPDVGRDICGTTITRAVEEGGLVIGAVQP